MSSSRTNHSFELVLFGELVEPVHCEMIQFTVRAAQIYKLLNQNSLLEAWQSLWLKMSQNSGVYDCIIT